MHSRARTARDCLSKTKTEKLDNSVTSLSVQNVFTPFCLNIVNNCFLTSNEAKCCTSDL